MSCLVLIFLLSINSFAAIVSDNDGSAFITKAEFDALKSSFQAQIDSYNQSIDSKIDGAIASYLAGIRIAKTASFTPMFMDKSSEGAYIIDYDSVCNVADNTFRVCPVGNIQFMKMYVDYTWEGNKIKWHSTVKIENCQFACATYAVPESDYNKRITVGYTEGGKLIWAPYFIQANLSVGSARCQSWTNGIYYNVLFGGGVHPTISKASWNNTTTSAFNAADIVYGSQVILQKISLSVPLLLTKDENDLFYFPTADFENINWNVGTERLEQYGNTTTAPFTFTCAFGTDHTTPTAGYWSYMQPGSSQYSGYMENRKLTLNNIYPNSKTTHQKLEMDFKNYEGGTYQLPLYLGAPACYVKDEQVTFDMTCNINPRKILFRNDTSSSYTLKVNKLTKSGTTWTSSDASFFVNGSTTSVTSATLNKATDYKIKFTGSQGEYYALYWTTDGNLKVSDATYVIQ